ncbi:SAM-dependent methyltransferase [Nocardiopsis algeriensis]|uniref:SAM-dependent methyltransferase n=1 Tax=Nocardiopsis algeriensis TaxID=1478215 RepID=UPI003B43CACE
MSRFTSPDFLRRAGAKGTRANPPPAVDLTRPSLARLHSFHLKGKDHFEADRELAFKAEHAVPGFQDLVLGERAFLQRAVRHLVEETGIRQFVQIGCGLPAPGDPHEIAHEAEHPTAGDTRVVYATDDLMVLAHHRALLRDERTIAVEGRLTEPRALLSAAELRGFLDLERPVGLLLAGTLSHVPDLDAPGEHLAALRDLLAPGSHLVLSHYCRPDAGLFPRDAARADQLERVFREHRLTGYWRTKDRIQGFLNGWDVTAPGLIEVQSWRTLPVAPPVPGSYQMPHRNRRLLVGALARI